MRERRRPRRRWPTETGAGGGAVRRRRASAGDAPDQTLVLPGQTMAFTDTPIYARTSGYLKSWNFDIGAHVQQGTCWRRSRPPNSTSSCARRSAQLAQTQAAVTQAEANMDLAKVTSGRTSSLVRQGWNSQQQGDQDRLTYAGSTAAVDVARANVRVAAGAGGPAGGTDRFESVMRRSTA